jgi:hypothetical protein
VDAAFPGAIHASDNPIIGETRYRIKIPRAGCRGEFPHRISVEAGPPNLHGRSMRQGAGAIIRRRQVGFAAAARR